VLSAGAAGAVVGTLLLRCDESGASRTHQDALADPRFSQTVMTRAFTGRPARALSNGFIARHEAGAPLGYPAIHHLTSGLRRAAAQAGDPDRVHLWSGTGFRAARSGPAAQILSSLVAGF
jgi:nitronate monooxygenase